MPVAEQHVYPVPIMRALQAAGAAFEDGTGPEQKHTAASSLIDAIAVCLGALGAAHYMEALRLGMASTDPTLNRSLRSLRRVLPGQWLLWAARGFAAAPGRPLEGASGWYAGRSTGETAQGYGRLRAVMLDRLGYAGEYGPREEVSPRDFLELVDQYRVRKGRAPEGSMDARALDEAAGATMLGARALLRSAAFLREYPLCLPGGRELPLEPEPADRGLAAPLVVTETSGGGGALLLSLDPLLGYLPCPECRVMRVAALSEVAGGEPVYVGLDPDCGHAIAGEQAQAG